jgi:hypothetical protein
MNRKLFALFAAAALSTTIACSHSPTSPGPTPGTPEPTPSPIPSPVPTPAPITQTFTGTVTAATPYWKMYELTPSRSGLAKLSLSWDNGTIDLDLSLTSGNCTEFDGSGCTLYQITNGATGTTEQIQRSMQAGEKYRVWVINAGDDDQAYRLDYELN